MVDLWREYQYRKLFHLTHDEYLAEPIRTVDWSLAFAALENRMEVEAMEKARDGG